MLPLKRILDQVVLLSLTIIYIPLVEQILLNAEYLPDEGERLVAIFALKSHPNETDDGVLLEPCLGVDH